MGTELTSYRDYLRRSFEDRISANPRYSLRAFARDIGLDPARLSLILSKKQGLSADIGRKIARKLSMSEQESNLFCLLIEAEHARNKVHRTIASAKARALVQNVAAPLSLDTFRIISDWYHFAILELASLDDFSLEVPQIAQALDLHSEVVMTAVERLKRVGLLAMRRGKLVPTEEFTFTGSGAPSDAIKQFHAQMLEKALVALKTQSVEERDFSSITLAFDEELIPAAREHLKQFRRNFSKSIGNTKRKTSLYALNIQFFRISKKSK